MQVILKKNIIGLGEEGDIVNVKLGYARNYLLPFELAVETTANNLRILEKHKEEIAKRKERIAQESDEMKLKIEALEVNLERQVVEGNKLYGSVSGKDVVTYLQEQGIEIGKQNVEMPGHIKMIGTYNIPVRLPSGTKASLKVNIKPLSDQ